MDRYFLSDIKDDINRYYQRQFKKSFRMVLDDLEEKYLSGFAFYTHELRQYSRIRKLLVGTNRTVTCGNCNTYHYGCENEPNLLIWTLRCICGRTVLCHDCSIPYGNIRYGLTYTYPNKRDLERVLGEN